MKRNYIQDAYNGRELTNELVGEIVAALHRNGYDYVILPANRVTIGDDGIVDPY